ncbi:MAG TPA: class I SAM-dependent methyltransferase [Solirubrobacterales bacterium]
MFAWHHEATASRDDEVDRFGRWAPTYDDSYLQRLVFEPVQRATLEAASRELPRPQCVLDVGCGTGQLLRRASASFPGAGLVGVDPAAEMVHQAAESLPAGIDARFVEGSAEDLPFADASFDLVVSSMSFHHWPDQHQGLREVCRVLAPGGLMALADAFVVGWLLRLAFRAAGNRDRFHTPEELDQMLARAGLRTVGRGVLPRMGGSVQVVVSRVAGGGAD